MVDKDKEKEMEDSAAVKALLEAIFGNPKADEKDENLGEEHGIEFKPEDLKNKVVTIKISAKDSETGEKTSQKGKIVLNFNEKGFEIIGDAGYDDPETPLEQLQAMIFTAIPDGIKSYFSK